MKNETLITINELHERAISIGMGSYYSMSPMTATIYLCSRSNFRITDEDVSTFYVWEEGEDRIVNDISNKISIMIDELESVKIDNEKE